MKWTHQLLLFCVLFCLLPLQLADPIGEVLGQGLNESKLNREATCTGGNSDIVENGEDPMGKGLAWEAKEYILHVHDKRYKFKEYLPEVFCHLRQKFQIDNDKFYASLTGTALKIWDNPADSGSAFLTSADEHFMLKSLSMKDNEPKVFQNQLPKYVDYMSSHPDSFITRYLGYYSVQEVGSGQLIRWFLCMPNILAYPTAIKSGIRPAKVDYRFDLKGYPFKRKAYDREWEKAEPTLREWEFNGPENEQSIFKDGILLEENVYKKVAEIVSQDAEFLGKKMAVFDYSLFLGIHFNDDNKEQGEAYGGGIPASCIGCKRPGEELVISGANAERRRRRSISLYVGIIDLLGPWNIPRICKMTNRCFFDQEVEMKKQAYVHPSKYVARFKCFFNRDVFHVEDENARRAYDEQYCADFNRIQWGDAVQRTEEDDRRTFGGIIDRSGKKARLIRENSLNGHFRPVNRPFLDDNLDNREKCTCGRGALRSGMKAFEPDTFIPSYKHLTGWVVGIRYGEELEKGTFPEVRHAEMVIKLPNKIAYKCVALKTNFLSKENAKQDYKDIVASAEKRIEEEWQTLGQIDRMPGEKRQQTGNMLGHGNFTEDGHKFVYTILELENSANARIMNLTASPIRMVVINNQEERTKTRM